MADLTTPVVTCEGCGLCCLEQCLLPRAGAIREKRELPFEVKAELDILHALDLVQYGDPCVWYDEAARRCKHYKYRPSTCRDFEVGGEDCLEIRRKRGRDFPPNSLDNSVVNRVG